MRIFLADSQPKVRSALRLLLEHETELSVIDEADEAAVLLTKAKPGCADLLLLDWNLPGAKPEELVSALRQTCPDLCIVAISGRPESSQTALEAGVDAFVSKGDPPETLLATLQEASATASRRVSTSRGKPRSR